MATKKFTVPNWSQALITKAVGLDPSNVAVEHEDDMRITFLQHMPRKTIMVNKHTGEMTEM